MSGWLTNGITALTPATYTALGAGSSQYPVDTEAAQGASPQSSAMPTTAGSQGLWASVTAAGASQGNATALTAFKNLVTVALTASTKGVKLPAAVTGLEVLVGNAATFGVKVYPASGDSIQAVATNGADGTVLAINKVNRYLAINASKWIVLRGS
jgi:hypothetical protein